ncbi:uncharacterized protein [Scyliorhinus torazame]|uniref:uncharacterized protein isoform X2 n=1 Tax=Scyliorhinus torazame TaxID=75743 RepID=UPI003B5A89F6
MVSRRLRNRVSLGVLEEDAQLDKKLETPVKSPQSPVDTLQRTRLTRSTFKKVDDFLLWFQTPTQRQSSRCSNGTPMLPPDMETPETPRRQLRQKLVHTQASAEESPRRSARNGRWLKSTSPGERLSQQGGCDGGNSEPEDGEELSEVQRTEPLDRESEKETEQTTPRMPQPDTGAENLQQTRNSDGRWLLKVHSGKRRSPTSDSKRDTGVKCNANDDDSPVTEIEAPDAESEKTKKHQNYARRKSQRISNQLRPHSSTTHYEDICLGHNASKPEEDEDTNCRPDAAEQSEMQTSNIKGRVEEELEVKKLEQDHVEMDKEEGKEGPGPCDISASFELEPGSLSGTDACRSSTQEEDEGMNCRRDIAEQSEMQTSNLCRTVKEELEVAKVDEDHVEMDKEAGKEGPGPCDISANFVLEPGSLSGTDACRRSTQGDSNSVSRIKIGIACVDWKLACETMSGRREAQAEEPDAEEAPPGAGGHGGRAEASCPESLPRGSERGEISSAPMQETANGEERPVLHTKATASRREVLLNETHGEATGNGECMVECAQHSGQIGTALNDTAPRKSENFGPIANKGHLENSSPSKLRSENVMAVKTHLSGSQTSDIEARRINLPGSAILETEATGTNLFGSSIAEPNSGGTNLPTSFISELQPEATDLPGSTILKAGANLFGSPMSEPDGGGTSLPGSFVMETDGEGANLPEVTTLEADGRTNLPGSHVSEPEAGGTGVPGATISESERAPSLTSQLQHKQRMANAEGLSTSPWESEHRSVETSVTSNGQRLENGGGELLLPPAEFGVCDLKTTGTDFKLLEEHSIRKETSALNICADFLASPREERAGEQVSVLAKCWGATLGAEGNSRLALEIPSSLSISETEAAVADSASEVAAKNQDGNAALKLKDVQLGRPAGEQAIQGGTGDGPGASAARGSQGGLKDPPTPKRSRRRRRRRGRKSCSCVQAGCESRGTDALPDVMALDGGQQTAGLTVPMSPTGAVQTSGCGVKESFSEGPRDVGANDTKFVCVKIILNCDQTDHQTERAVQTEADVEGGVISEPLMVGEETGGMMRKLETDKAEMLVAFEEVEGENDQTEAIAMNLDQKWKTRKWRKAKRRPSQRCG